MNCFKRHLNLTWVIVTILSFGLGYYLSIYGKIGIFIFATGTLTVSAWVLYQKGRSMAWLLLGAFWVILLTNKKETRL
jgi:hypothetical protein